MTTLLLVLLFMGCYYCYQNTQNPSNKKWFYVPMLGLGALLGLKVLGIFVTILYYIIIGVALFTIGSYLLRKFE